jgi:hypothetical protein
VGLPDDGGGWFASGIAVDNYASHRHAAVRAWWAGIHESSCSSRPTYGSRLNLVEVFFAIIEQ